MPFVPGENGVHRRDAPAVADRVTMRRAALAARESMTPDEHAHASAEIERRLATVLSGRPPSIVGFCWPVKKEFDCRPLILRLIGAGWRACQPVAQAPATAMIFRAWTPTTAMTTDCYGIPVPAGGEPMVPDIVLIPLVAFDDHGFRLGYGGGHFDRTLAALAPRPLTIGIGFERGRVPSIHPEPHDVPLDMIVTEAGPVRRPCFPSIS